MVGSYTFGWVAGVGGEDTRLFNVKITESSSTLRGEAFFGFGTAMQSTSYDGLVSNFYCNWTQRGKQGITNERGTYDGSQRQRFSLSSNGFWRPDNFGTSENANQIFFAPTTTCGQTGAHTSGTSFRYDQDLNSSTLELPGKIQLGGQPAGTLIQTPVTLPNLKTTPSGYSTYKSYVNATMAFPSGFVP